MSYKNVGFRRLSKPKKKSFFGRLGGAMKSISNDIKEYSDKAPERRQAELRKLKDRVSIEKERAELRRLRNQYKDQDDLFGLSKPYKSEIPITNNVSGNKKKHKKKKR